MSSENLPTPSTITASKLKPEIIKNFGHPLPKKYENLLHLFVEMEKIVSIKYGRDMRITFDDVAKNVIKNTKISFNETTLAQIMGVFGTAYDLRWDKHRQPIGKAQVGKQFDLIILPNLKNDLDPYLKENILEDLKIKSPVKPLFSPPKSAISPTKQFARPKRIDRTSFDIIPPAILISPRKLQSSPIRKEFEAKDELQLVTRDSFRIVTPTHLISPTKQVEKVYIKRSPLKSMPNTPNRRVFVSDPKPRMGVSLQLDQLLHPDFELDKILDIKSGVIPQMPNVDTPLRTMRDFFGTVDKVILPKEGTPTKEAQSILPNSPEKSTKVSLLERIKAKELALKAAKEQHDPTIDRRISALHFLKQSMVEVICSHFRTSKVSAMNLPTVRERVNISCGPIDKDNFMEYIDVLCNVAPRYCSKETFIGESLLKIPNARTDPKIFVKIIKCIENELIQLNIRKSIKTEICTPGSNALEIAKAKGTSNIKSEVLSQAN
ncbi:DNA replication factor CDT1 like domain-containing protein [Ditylenchus destructor]|nr:DNA replication factor CDT1 like domain-containing protein [Ditylenchus destructor]